MVTLTPEEKVSTIMAYTQTSLIRGELVTREAVRVNTWLRTEGAPDYIHLYKSQWIQFSGGPLKPLVYSELIVPVPIVLGFHIAPPAQESLDYDESESNRINIPLTVLMGVFVVKGKARISAKSDIATSLQISHAQWLSIYEADISSPNFPQMSPFHVPMLIVRPLQVGFVLQE
jgi:hypothetical protein